MSSVLILYDILVTGIELPAAIVAAINRKTEQYYIAEEYKFRVEREKRESERKKIEAEGIRDFQQTVSQGISDSYLRWRGIEATLQLSQSTNSKVIVIGTGKDGLPVILGNGDAPAPPAGSITPDGNDNKERTTAASPARSTRP
jgi:regulator of protease activity HflC (stomatin/prohibitin superfamily)